MHALSRSPSASTPGRPASSSTSRPASPSSRSAVFFNQRTNPLYRDLKALLGSGELGALRHTLVDHHDVVRPQGYYDQSDWRATWGGEGGGVLVNQVPHQLDLWQWICGVPKSVFASARTDSGVTSPSRTR